ncbi:helix-turn-helix transcriptional regulator [Micromonospora sp. NBRC 101691]|uniref:helix-turn-helix domain-containing protein n=1 Tax=Micromonospora sp. NBRC 101691 TaxID=3032198 RepID=UPI0024A3B475|nr:helix-turn-helix transcriptional regulator [Micromonospora sp. NBRC 101691]GLY22636.1 DNA-binding protein [Micromonospora sp. NBRC 101691]
MTTHIFTVVLDRQPTDAELDALFVAGCDDAAFGTENNLPIAEFDREAETMADAIATAVHSLDEVGLVALRILDQDLVTLADVAERIGQSRESVRRYASGERGPGNFPPPVNPAREGTVFYRWSEVAPWVRDNLRIEIADSDPALVVANLVLQARQHRQRVAHMAALTDLLAA